MSFITNFDKSKTCAFTGHRILPADFDVEKLEKAVYKAVNEGFNVFLVGMAIGFDSVCFRVLEGLRLTNDIKIVACIPCKDQAEYYNEKQKKEYDRMILSADEKIVLSEKYYNGCMRVRNEFMVDNSSKIIAFLKIPGGGTYSTVKYAIEKGIEIEYIK